MKFVVFYETAPDAVGVLQQHFPEHRARWGEFRGRGQLLAIGPFGDGSGAMAVFTSREAAEEFAAGDPFVRHGAVASWTIREWNEVLL